MRTGQTNSGRALGRVAAVVALACGAAWIGWRVATFGGAPWWLGAPTLAVEAVGLLAVAVTVWALWRRPESARPIDHARHHDVLDAEIVVRCTGQDAPAVRATLLAARPLAPVVVLDLDARSEIAALAVEHGARYLATDPDDVDGLVAASRIIDAASLLLLEAGDIPHPAVLRILAPWLDEPSVAVVQGPVVARNGESAEHGTGGRHDQQFERRALLPSLGARGLGAVAGSGALIRVAALHSVDVVRSSPQMVLADLTAGLFRAGWQIAAPGGDPVVAVAPITSPAVVEDVRACEASAARHLVLGRHGAWRPNRLTLAQRLALTALAVRPLAGVRRGLVVALLAGVLLAGRLPFDPDATWLLAAWTPWFVLAAVALHQLSDGELRPGDRVRWSMRMLGASWRGLVAPDGRPDPAERVLGSVFGLHHGVASAAAVAAISVVIGMRALSDRLTHTLAAMPVDRTAAVLLVALWSLAGGLDALRMLARRARSRRATRIASSLPSTFADHAALVVDLTPLGAGVLADHDLPLGSSQRLDVVVPTASGVVSATVPVTIRNVRTDFSGERRYGVEFGALEPYVANALTEYCVVQPALEVLVGATVDPALAGGRTVVVLDDQPVMPRRMGLRAAALVAVAGAMASAAPTAEASAPATRVEGVITVAAAQDGAQDGTQDGEVATAPPMLPDPSASTLPAPPDTADLPSVTTGSTGSTGSAGSTDGSGSAGATDEVPPTPGAASAEGTLVAVVCSIDAGADGEWGTSDDHYAAPVSTVVDADGRWAVEIDGRACWASLVPPPGLMIAGETGAPESPVAPTPLDLSNGTAPRVEFVLAAPPADPVDGGAGTEDPTDASAAAEAAVLVEDVVWHDRDADGVIDPGEPFVEGVTITLVDGRGVAVGNDVTDRDGRFRIDADAGDGYRLVATNLPTGLSTRDVFGRSREFSLEAGTDSDLSIGLLSADGAAAAATPGGGDAGTGTELVGVDSTGTTGTAGPTVRLLAAPADGQVGATSSGGAPVGAWLVVVLATVIGVSVMAGSLRPSRSSAFAPSVPRHR